MSSPSNKAFNDERIAATTFLWCDEPIRFSHLSSRVKNVVETDENQLAWLLSHPDRMLDWSKTFHQGLENPRRAIDWLLLLHSNHGPRNTVSCMLTRKSVLVSTIRHIFTQKSYHSGFTSNGLSTLQTALLAFAAREVNLAAIRTALQFSHTYDLLKASNVWKDIVCAIIHCGEDQDIAYLEKLIEIHPNIPQELEDAPAFASRLGKLFMLKTLVRRGKYQIHNTRLVDMLNLAHEKHFGEIVQYLCDEAGATDEGKSVIRTWRAIGAAAEAFEARDEGKISHIIENLAGETVNDNFRTQWKAITLMAASKGTENVLKRLLSFMTNPSFSAAKLGLTHRMLVMALSTQNYDHALEMINCIDQGTLTSDENVFFGNLPAIGVPRLSEIMFRFCDTSNLALFRSMFPTFPEKALAAWLDTVKGHRLDMIVFLLQNCFQQDPNFTISNNCIWAAFRAGHVEIADALKTAGADIGWMEEFSDDHQLSGDLMMIPEEKEQVDGAPDSALAVIRGYGTSASSVLGSQTTPAEITRLHELDEYLRQNDFMPKNKDKSVSSKLGNSSSPILGHLTSRIRSKQFFATVPFSVMTAEGHDTLWDALLTASPNDIGNLIKGGSKDGSSLAWMEPSQSSDVEIPSYLQISYQTLTEATSASPAEKNDVDRSAVLYGLGGSFF